MAIMEKLRIKTETEKAVELKIKQDQAEMFLNETLASHNDTLEKYADKAQGMIDRGASEEMIAMVLDSMCATKEVINEIEFAKLQADVIKTQIELFNTRIQTQQATGILLKVSLKGLNPRKLEKQQKEFLKQMNQMRVGTAILKRGTETSINVAPRTNAERNEMLNFIKSRTAGKSGATGDLSSEIDSI